MGSDNAGRRVNCNQSSDPFQWAAALASAHLDFSFEPCDSTGFVAAPSLLLIDDDPRIVPEQVNHTFWAPEYKVEVVGSGKDGLDAVR